MKVGIVLQKGGALPKMDHGNEAELTHSSNLMTVAGSRSLLYHITTRKGTLMG
jgi:hypothetical protein